MYVCMYVCMYIYIYIYNVIVNHGNNDKSDVLIELQELYHDLVGDN